MENFEKASTTEETKELKEFVEKYFKLQTQIINPTRDGMIDALSSAQCIAYDEISTLEISQGDIYLMPWSSFSNNDLFRKLPQYQQGLYINAVNRFGEDAFKKLLNEYTKANQDH